MNDFKKYRWILFGLIGTLYFLVCLHRMSPTVIARDLALSFHADAVVLGLIASSYFYLYSAAQPIVGYLSDTVGPRKVMTVSFILAAIGAVIFGTASDTTMLIVGRTLVGAGAGGIFIPALKSFSRWYRVDEFAVITGLMLTIGGLGALSAALPLTYLVLWVGWRAAFVSIGFLSLVLAVTCWIIVRDKPEDRGWPAIPAFGLPLPEVHVEQMGLGKRMALILGNLDFWMLTLATFFTGGVVITFQGLWAVPYLMDVFGLDRVGAGWLLMLLPLGFACGGPGLGFFTNKMKLNQKSVLLGAWVISLLGWVLLLFVHDRAYLFMVPFLFFIFGVAGGGTAPIMFTITRNLFPPELMGTAAGLMNTAAFVGTAIYQPFTGYLLQQYPVVQKGVYSFAAYRSLLLVFLVSFAAAIAATAMLTGRKR